MRPLSRIIAITVMLAACAPLGGPSAGARPTPSAETKPTLSATPAPTAEPTPSAAPTSSADPMPSGGVEQTGDQLWKVEVTGQPGAIGVVGDRVYLATDLGRVIAIGNTP